MNKTIKIILGIVLLILFVFVLKYFKDSNAKDIIDYKTESPFYTSLDTKIVATGKLNPEEEIELKPQISGIVDKILVEEGDLVQKGDLIAKIRVVPNEQALVSAQSRIKTTKFTYDNAKTLFNRNKALYEKGVISRQDFENIKLKKAIYKLKTTIKLSSKDQFLVGDLPIPISLHKYRERFYKFPSEKGIK